MLLSCLTFLRKVFLCPTEANFVVIHGRRKVILLIFQGFDFWIWYERNRMERKGWFRFLMKWKGLKKRDGEDVLGVYMLGRLKVGMSISCFWAWYYMWTFYKLHSTMLACSCTTFTGLSRETKNLVWGRWRPKWSGTLLVKHEDHLSWEWGDEKW